MKICLSLLICLFTTLTYAQTTRTLFNSEILYGNIKQISETQNSVKIIPGKPGKLMMPITDTTFFDKNGYTIERHSNADSLTIYKYQTIFDKRESGKKQLPLLEKS